MPILEFATFGLVIWLTWHLNQVSGALARIQARLAEGEARRPAVTDAAAGPARHVPYLAADAEPEDPAYGRSLLDGSDRPAGAEAEAIGPVPRRAAPAERPVPVEEASAGRVPLVPLVAPAPAAKASPLPAPPRPGFEAAFGRRWAVILGGAALAFGVVLLVRRSLAEAGGDVATHAGMRLFLGALLSVALMGAAELLLRRGFLAGRMTLPKGVPDVPSTLFGVGAAGLYATAFSAHAVYGMLGAASTFGILGALTATVLLVSGRYGPPLAIIGLVAAQSGPFLVGSELSFATAAYVSSVGVAGYVLAHRQGWRWLELMALGAMAAWAFLLRAGLGADAGTEVMTIGATAVVSALAFSALRLSPRQAFAGKVVTDRVGDAAVVVAAVLAVVVARGAFGGWDMPLGLALGMLVMCVGAFAPGVSLGFPFGAIAVGTMMYLLLKMGWHRGLPLGKDLTVTDYLGPEPWAMGVRGYVAVSLVTFALAVWAVLRTSRVSASAARWALGCSCTIAGALDLGMAVFSAPVARGLSTPSVMYYSGQWGAAWDAAAFARHVTRPMILTAFDIMPYWAIPSLLLLKGLALLAACRADGRLPARRRPVAVMASLVGLGFVLAALVLLLSGAWLAIAASLFVLALVGVAHGRRLPEAIALVGPGAFVAVNAIAILALPEKRHGLPPIEVGSLVLGVIVPWCILGTSWLLLGYLGRGEGAGSVRKMTGIAGTTAKGGVTLLGCVSAFLGIVLGGMAVRALVFGSYAAKFDPPVDLGLVATALWAFGRSLRLLPEGMVSGVRARASLAFWAGLAAMALAVLCNPYMTEIPLAGAPVFGLLTVAYLLPAALAVDWAGRSIRGEGGGGLSPMEAAAGLAVGSVTAFLYMSASISQAFQGKRVAVDGIANPELWAHSIAWLAVGALLMVRGARRDEPRMRVAALGVLIALAAKTLVVDLQRMPGAMGALSFIMVGAALLCTGIYYQRRQGESPG